MRYVPSMLHIGSMIEQLSNANVTRKHVGGVIGKCLLDIMRRFVPEALEQLIGHFFVKTVSLTADLEPNSASQRNASRIQQIQNAYCQRQLGDLKQALDLRKTPSMRAEPLRTALQGFFVITSMPAKRGHNWYGWPWKSDGLGQRARPCVEPW